MIAVYATTILDSRTGRAGVGPAPQPGTGTGDTRTPPIPHPRRPLDDVSQALEHAPEAPGTARRTAQNVLQAWQVNDEAIDAVMLVVSELVTNAVEHAQAPLALHLHRERAGCRVWVGVTDSGPAQTEGAWTASCAGDEHGRGLGLAIVETLADAHGTRSHTGGTTHWARIAA
ncbi:ATP-binding protein [Streptomyces sp. NBC_00151]|uniref:ATP-binding protein n=1 Tax=Streptomyces sp. NBC_00151 TaxID=2975669 RepID=UPI002DDC3E59|nr:ATP-binding protein [Streptomyces sp. NBC_00151]WRZ36646.1 ATP-binding protein [Streptomyces sp. NBC_00151]WRZ44927.1 ATP-binding protein [Streptomyces sp. NBC_00151]